MKNLTKKQLKYKLEILKEILKNYDEKKFYNISFINIDSFYSHLELYNKTNFKVKEIIKSIDNYIPLKNLLDIELIEIFQAGICCNNIDELNYFRTIFYKKVVIKFFYLIKNTKTKNEWEQILIDCENIRKMG